MERIYLIQQIEDAPDHATRAKLTLDLPFSILMTYQDTISRLLRARDDQSCLEYIIAVLAYLRATRQGREDAGNLVNSLSKKMREAA